MKASLSRRWLRIIPVAVVMYILAYVDRINVAMILPYLDSSLKLSSQDLGFAAGIFFVGYMLLQVPAGILASRWGARRVVAALMILWSLAAVATGCVHSRTQLYLARLALGVCEGGVWPAVLVLLTSWFPQDERARANALWMICLPISAVLMAPATGWLLTVLSWRWVFVLEGLPPLLWLPVWWLAVADRPAEARWISDDERRYLEHRLEAERAAKPAFPGYLATLADPVVLRLSAVYFFWMTGFYGFTLWVPSVVKSFAAGNRASRVGLIVAVPFAFALAAMVLNAAWSDRRRKRQAHVWGPLLLAVVGLVGGWLFVRSPGVELAFLTLTAVGVYAPFGPFWAIPGATVPAGAVGAAIGIVNAIGNLGGFAGPYLVGYASQRTHSDEAGLAVLSASLLITVGISARLGVDRGRPGSVPLADGVA